MSAQKCKKKIVDKVMKEFEQLKLKQRDESVVTNNKQAIAIALSKADDECKLSSSDYKEMEIKVITFLTSKPSKKIVFSRVIETKHIIEYYVKKNNIRKARKYEIELWHYLISCVSKGLEISENIWEQLNEIKNIDYNRNK
jgi:hypothetical protein